MANGTLDLRPDVPPPLDLRPDEAPAKPTLGERIFRPVDRAAANFIEAFGLPADIRDWHPIEGAKFMAEHPVEAAKLVGGGILQSHAQAAALARQRMARPGVLPKLVGGTEWLESGIPFFGPSLVQAGREFEAGDIAGGVGTMAGTAAAMFSPKGFVEESAFRPYTPEAPVPEFPGVAPAPREPLPESPIVAPAPRKILALPPAPIELPPSTLGRPEHVASNVSFNPTEEMPMPTGDFPAIKLPPMSGRRPYPVDLPMTQPSIRRLDQPPWEGIPEPEYIPSKPTIERPSPEAGTAIPLGPIDPHSLTPEISGRGPLNQPFDVAKIAEREGEIAQGKPMNVTVDTQGDIVEGHHGTIAAARTGVPIEAQLVIDPQTGRPLTSEEAEVTKVMRHEAPEGGKEAVPPQSMGDRAFTGGGTDPAREVPHLEEEQRAIFRPEGTEGIATAAPKVAEVPSLTESVARQPEKGAVTLQALRSLPGLPGELWRKFVAQPILGKIGMRGKYPGIEKSSPELAEFLWERQNAPGFFRSVAKQQLDEVTKGLSHEQERLATMMSDESMRQWLKANKPQEYGKALHDPAVMAAVDKYRPLQQALTQLRQASGAPVLTGDYLQRVYEEHLGKPGGVAPPPSFFRAVSERDLPAKSRIAPESWYYQHGVHEFGPAYGPKFVGHNLAALDNAIVDHLERVGTVLPRGADFPRQITYAGKTYYSQDYANLVKKNLPTYDRFDPSAMRKFKVSPNLILLPKEVVRALEASTWHREELTPVGKAFAAGKTLYQKGIIGLTLGMPHAFWNVPKRIAISYRGGALNPASWVESFKVVFGRELQRATAQGFADPKYGPVYSKLAQAGAVVVPGEEPYGFAAGVERGPMGVGHKLIFKPGTLKIPGIAPEGLGGVDIRARVRAGYKLLQENPNARLDQLGQEINGLYGDYTRANWTRDQRGLGKMVVFPGWLYSSISTALNHPLRAAVPAAVLIYAVNQALHGMGLNRSEDAKSISRIHVGNYAISWMLFSEPVAKTLMAAPLEEAQARLQGRKAQPGQEIARGVGALSGHLHPLISLPLELVANRKYLSPTSGEIVKKGEERLPAEHIPGISRATEERLAHVAGRIPQAGRAFGFGEPEQGFDVPTAVGGLTGVFAQKQTPASRVFGYQEALENSKGPERQEILERMKKDSGLTLGEKRQLFRGVATRKTSLVKAFEAQSAEDALKMWPKFSPDERRELRSELVKKLTGIMQRRDLLMPEKIQLRRKLLGVLRGSSISGRPVPSVPGGALYRPAAPQLDLRPE